MNTPQHSKKFAVLLYGISHKKDTNIDLDIQKLTSNIHMKITRTKFLKGF